MGINVYLKDEAGTVLGEAFDPSMLLSRFATTPAATESHLLRYLDPYGDLVLNRAQATMLIKDLAAIIPKQHGGLRVLLETVCEFAEQSVRGVHLYLWFIGD